MLRRSAYDLVDEDGYDMRIPAVSEEAFQYGIVFKLKYVGSLEIPRPSSRTDIIAAMRRIRCEYKLRSSRKKKVVMIVSVDGIKVFPRKKKLATSRLLPPFLRRDTMSSSMVHSRLQASNDEDSAKIVRASSVQMLSSTSKTSSQAIEPTTAGDATPTSSRLIDKMQPVPKQLGFRNGQPSVMAASMSAVEIGGSASAMRPSSTSVLASRSHSHNLFGSADRGLVPEDEPPLFHHQIHRIFFVSHYSPDVKVFSYIARSPSSHSTAAVENGNSLSGSSAKPSSSPFTCFVFKTYKKSEAIRIVRTIGQSFEVCHSLKQRLQNRQQQSKEDSQILETNNYDNNATLSSSSPNQPEIVRKESTDLLSNNITSMARPQLPLADLMTPCSAVPKPAQESADAIQQQQLSNPNFPPPGYYANQVFHPWMPTPANNNINKTGLLSSSFDGLCGAASSEDDITSAAMMMIASLKQPQQQQQQLSMFDELIAADAGTTSTPSTAIPRVHPSPADRRLSRKSDLSTNSAAQLSPSSAAVLRPDASPTKSKHAQTPTSVLPASFSSYSMSMSMSDNSYCTNPASAPVGSADARMAVFQRILDLQRQENEASLAQAELLRQQLLAECDARQAAQQRNQQLLLQNCELVERLTTLFERLERVEQTVNVNNNSFNSATCSATASLDRCKPSAFSAPNWQPASSNKARPLSPTKINIPTWNLAPSAAPVTGNTSSTNGGFSCQSPNKPGLINGGSQQATLSSVPSIESQRVLSLESGASLRGSFSSGVVPSSQLTPSPTFVNGTPRKTSTNSCEEKAPTPMSASKLSLDGASKAPLLDDHIVSAARENGNGTHCDTEVKPMVVVASNDDHDSDNNDDDDDDDDDDDGDNGNDGGSDKNGWKESEIAGIGENSVAFSNNGFSEVH